MTKKNKRKGEKDEMKKIEVNALGAQCPIPVVKATKALKEMKEPGIVEVHVDNEVAVQNLLRLAQSQNLEAKSEKLEEKHFIVAINYAGDPVKAEEANIACIPDSRADTVVVISSDRMGSGNDELGKVLMKGFIYAVSQLERLPKAVLFYNGGATITTEGSVSIEDLKSMEAQGVEIMTCGTCLDYYNLKDKLAVGTVTNMYNIVETMNGAGKILRP